MEKLSKAEIEAALERKSHEIFMWSSVIKERAVGKLPDGTPIEDFDGAFAAINSAQSALSEARGIVEDLFNAD